jgi:uncharacterized repeat protein (TIGR03943 family)
VSEPESLGSTVASDRGCVAVGWHCEPVVAMNQTSRGLTLILLGGAVLQISAFSTQYMNYVKPGFRPLLIIAGVIVSVLGVISIVRDWREPNPADTNRERRRQELEEAHLAALLGREPVPLPSTGSHEGRDSHDHSRTPRVAWLLCLPALTIFLITPPALGSFAAVRRGDAPPPPPPAVVDPYAPLTGEEPIEMPVGEFMGRAWDDPHKSLMGKQVRLTGFVVPDESKGRWYVTRMAILCCAADAIALKVAIDDAPAPPENTWVEVTGTWVPPVGKVAEARIPPRMTTTKVVKIAQPAAPYE